MSWYNFWKKKSQIEVKLTSIITKKTIDYKKESMNLCKTLVRIDLEDGTVLHKEIKGSYYQMAIDNRGYSYDSSIGHSITTTSLEKAIQYTVFNLGNTKEGLCNLEDKSKFYYSKPLKAEIVSTEDYFEDVQVAFIKEVQIEQKES
jgi:hypothetical protein